MTALRRIVDRARRNPGEQGQAMLVVLAAVALLATVPLAMVATTTGELPLSSQKVNYDTSLEAAQAGLSDYLERLSTNQNYVIYNASNPAPDGNKAFTSWVQVYGTSNPTEWFRYTPNTATAAVSGVVTLTVSGRAGQGQGAVVRTIQVGLRRVGFLDYIYFTNYETEDPALYANPTTAAENCEYHQYDPNPYSHGTGPSSSYGCANVNFITADTLHGPVHSNDGFYICGSPTFTSSVTSSNPAPTAAGRWIGNGSCTNSPNFARAGDPAYQPVLAMPPTDTGLEAETTIGQSGAGCLYTGPTLITLNSTGTMTVSSADTKSTNPNCVGTNVPLPANGVIYVQNIPASSSDPNYWPGSPCPPAGAPITGLLCTSGDAIVHGVLKGQLTIAAEDDVVIDGNLTYNGGTTGTDVLGLIADNNVEVNHPVSGSSNAATCGSGGGTSCDLSNPTIDAAMLSLSHSFVVPNWTVGATLGTLSVTGSIAQDFRGPVGTFNSGVIVTGYTKNYVYDGRLQYLSPPYYLSPVDASWHPISYAEVQPAYSS